MCSNLVKLIDFVEFHKFLKDEIKANWKLISTTINEIANSNESSVMNQKISKRNKHLFEPIVCGLYKTPKKPKFKAYKQSLAQFVANMPNIHEIGESKKSILHDDDVHGDDVRI